MVAILGALTTLAAATFTAAKGILVPKDTWTDALQDDFETDTKRSDMSLLTAWSPYLIVVALLLLTRIVSWLWGFTTTVLDLSWDKILDVEEVTSNWELLYSPGTILTVTALLAVLIQRLLQKSPFHYQNHWNYAICHACGGSCVQ